MFARLILYLVEYSRFAIQVHEFVRQIIQDFVDIHRFLVRIDFDILCRSVFLFVLFDNLLKIYLKKKRTIVYLFQIEVFRNRLRLFDGFVLREICEEVI